MGDSQPDRNFFRLLRYCIIGVDAKNRCGRMPRGHYNFYFAGLAVEEIIDQRGIIIILR